MAPQQQQQTVFVSKTQHYLKVKKPLLERQRRARINKCLDSLKTLIAEFQGDDAILRMDKAEMLEAAIVFMRNTSAATKPAVPAPAAAIPMDSFRNGYINAVTEVSRVMAATGMSVEIGKSVMTRLGGEFNRMLQPTAAVPAQTAQNETCSARPMSRASSGYHSESECDDSASSTGMASPKPMWRPW